MDTSTTTRPSARSVAAWDAASVLMPGGFLPAYAAMRHADDAAVPSGYAGPAGAFGATPLPVLVKSKGAVVTDVDGNEYIDFCGGQAAPILGYADERIVAAISKAASKGFGFSLPTETELRLVELIAARLPSVDMLRLVNTPADALAGATNVAREHTGHDHVLLLGRAYAGHDPTPSVSVLPDFNLETLCAELGRRSSAAAAVVVDSLSALTRRDAPAAHGSPQAASADLAALRAYCDEHGALLIFDETITGLRTRPGSIGDSLGARPDLTLLGPIIGGGLPLAAYGGRRDVMRAAARQASSSALSNSGLPSVPQARLSLLAIAAGMATLQALSEPGFYEALDELAARLEDGLSTVAAESVNATASIKVHRVQSILHVSFGLGGSREESSPSSERRPHGNSGVSLHDPGPAAFAPFHRELLDRGILIPPFPNSYLWVSAAHTAEEIDRTIEAARAAFGTLALQT